MGTLENRAIAERHWEFMYAKDWDGVASQFAPDAEYMDVGAVPPAIGPRAIADPNADSAVSSVVVQGDGKILIAGAFITVGGETRNSVARLNIGGTLDTTFADPNADGSVDSVAVQGDGKILIGGNFTSVGGVARNYVARLDVTTATTTTTTTTTTTVASPTTTVPAVASPTTTGPAVASPTTTGPAVSLPETGRDMSRVGVVGLLCAVTGMVFLWRRRVSL